MKASVLQNLQHNSPLQAQARIHAQGGKANEKSLLFSLNLTTLIDAFCILVLFLLSNMHGQVQNIKISKDMILPVAQNSVALEDGVIVRIEKDTFFIDDKIVTKSDITKELLRAISLKSPDSKHQENSSLIIQADRNSNYENISWVLRAGGQVGIEKYVFAVLPGT